MHRSALLNFCCPLIHLLGYRACVAILEHLNSIKVLPSAQSCQFQSQCTRAAWSTDELFDYHREPWSSADPLSMCPTLSICKTWMYTHMISVLRVGRSDLLKISPGFWAKYLIKCQHNATLLKHKGNNTACSAIAALLSCVYAASSFAKNVMEDIFSFKSRVPKSSVSYHVALRHTWQS